MKNRRPPDDRPVCRFCYCEITTAGICNCPDNDEGPPITYKPTPPSGKKGKK